MINCERLTTTTVTKFNFSNGSESKPKSSSKVERYPNLLIFRIQIRTEKLHGSGFATLQRLKTEKSELSLFYEHRFTVLESRVADPEEYMRNRIRPQKESGT